ncbi:MAG: hypothetical protein NZM27_12240 [Acetobacteraceae bacterium]|nr:hypothetical protein [Acetobacteraceae bacterium]MDW8398745.1 hypothetical protein [Acetobacteraceae bacterium]
MIVPIRAALAAFRIACRRRRGVLTADSRLAATTFGMISLNSLAAFTQEVTRSAGFEPVRPPETVRTAAAAPAMPEKRLMEVPAPPAQPLARGSLLDLRV